MRFGRRGGCWRLGIAEPIGDGLGRIVVAARQLEVFLEVDSNGEKGAVDVLCFYGIGGSHKFVIKR